MSCFFAIDNFWAVVIVWMGKCLFCSVVCCVTQLHTIISTVIGTVFTSDLGPVSSVWVFLGAFYVFCNFFVTRASLFVLKLVSYVCNLGLFFLIVVNLVIWRCFMGCAISSSCGCPQDFFQGVQIQGCKKVVDLFLVVTLFTSSP